MRSVLALTLLFAGVLASGCQRRSLEGAWEAVGVRPIVLTFEPGGRYTVTTPLVEALVARGEYRLDGSNLVLDRPKVEVAGEAGVELGLDGRALNRLGAGRFQVAWKSQDEIVLTGDGLLAGGYRRQQ